jgi:hypothetical protein
LPLKAASSADPCSLLKPVNNFTPLRGKIEPVVTGSTVKHVVPGSAPQHVVASIAVDNGRKVDRLVDVAVIVAFAQPHLDCPHLTEIEPAIVANKAGEDVDFVPNHLHVHVVIIGSSDNLEHAPR